MKQGWEIRPFEKCIEKVKYTTKIATCDYSTMGAYPVVSQEEEYISGYWNNAEDVFKVSKPVVIFGDHTRVLKYVDFDFVLGADGVKILQPIDAINAKFFLYYLIASKIPSLGYSRHYKLLKELNVPVPPIAEQAKIVAELDCLSGIIEKKKQQLKELDNLAQSIFYEMFGDPVENDKGWKVKKLGDVCDIICGQDYKSVKDDNGKYPIYGTGGIMGYASEYRCPAETVIIGRKGNINNPIYVDCEFWNVDTAFGVVPNKTVIAPMYFYFFCKNYDFTIHDVSVTIPSLRRTDIIKIDVPVPSLNIQKEFVSKIESIEKQKELIAQSIKETETLFNSRMDYYFN